MMPDGYYLPALVLTVLLLPAFVQLYRRSRDTRILLWLLGFAFAALRMLQAFRLGLWDLSDPAVHPWLVAAGQVCVQISYALFLASLSPLGFRIGRVRVLYAIPFTVPLTVYALVLYGHYHGQTPGGLPFLIFPALGALSLLVGCFWSITRGSMPIWTGLALCIILGGTALRVSVTGGAAAALLFVECSAYLITALLVLYVFRRATLGTVLGILGFLAWSMRGAEVLPGSISSPVILSAIQMFVIYGRVLAVLGLILIALENEIAVHEAAKERERGARKELEAYTGLTLARRRMEDFDRQGTEICKTVVAHSRFSQAALMLLQGHSRYHLAGAAGFEDAAVNALDALALRIPVEGFLAPGSLEPAVEDAQTYRLNFTPWLLPGDDLERLRLTSVFAVPLRGANATEGALLLASPRDPLRPLAAHDLLPVEVLAARIQAHRTQTQMLEKLVDAEKFAGLGQLAGNVTRQFNNPLTVILGYASLLEEAEDLNDQSRRGVTAILNEARSMRSTLESLSRMSHSQDEHFAAISVTELLADMEQLHRSEFMHRSINFRLNVPPTLPRVLGNSQQVRQAVLYCLQFAIEAVETLDSGLERTVRIDASAEAECIKIVITHTGPGFLHPARAFDPFVPAQASGETAGLGLSLCATILRENNGRISAMNVKPRGAAIVLELQIA